jgi:hypothetical protein
MKKVADLLLGFRDAENYKRKENKDLFNSIFLRTQSLDKLCDPSKFFLVGEKGTGKTAYAVYLSNNIYRNNVTSLRYIRETEYQKFVTLKRSNNLDLSDFTNIWKVIIYLLISQQIREKEKSKSFFGTFNKFTNLEKAIDDYYQNAFSPEIIYAIKFAEEAKIAAELIAKYAKASGEEKTSLSFTENRFQTNLLYIQRQFEDALKSLKLNNNHILFIDGIDIRPASIPYPEYLECVKGLANAIWSLNNDFFSNIKDSKGRLRVVLLIRPDIFDSLGLQNQNSKIRDNAVVLDWITTYKEYRNSPIFEMTDRLLMYQQDRKLGLGEAWDYYFPYDAPSVRSEQRFKSSFITFLRHSLYRPRDILTMLSIQQENIIEMKKNTGVFSIQDFNNPSFTRKYSDYLLGEVKDHLSFYYATEDYEVLLKFFQFLNGNSRFAYEEYLSYFSKYISFLKVNGFTIPTFCGTPDNFLQFLYDLNIICYIVDAEDEPFFGWCYRERSPSNISPKVRTFARYDIHYGLMKALDLGKKLSSKKWK